MEFSGIPRSENVSDEDGFTEFSHMKKELMSRQQDPSSIRLMGPCPWCTILTHNAIPFVQFNLVKFALLLETIRLRAQNQQISWTKTK